MTSWFDSCFFTTFRTVLSLIAWWRYFHITSPDVVFTTDKSANFWNPVLSLLTDLSLEEIMHHDCDLSCAYTDTCWMKIEYVHAASARPASPDFLWSHHLNGQLWYDQFTHRENPQYTRWWVRGFFFSSLIGQYTSHLDSDSAFARVLIQKGPFQQTQTHIIISYNFSLWWVEREFQFLLQWQIGVFAAGPLLL